MKRLLFNLPFAIFASMLIGCASINQTVRTETHQTNGVVEIRETKNRIFALWDAKQTVEKTKLSNGKTQGIGVTGADQEVTSTNILGELNALARLAEALRPPSVPSVPVK